jgi:hypothetical protein
LKLFQQGIFCFVASIIGNEKKNVSGGFFFRFVESFLPKSGFELTTLVVIGVDQE